MTLPPESIAALKLFIEKVDKLAGLSFAKRLEERGTSIEIKAVKSVPVEIKYSGPDDEQVEAYTLTQRFFLQNNDSISIANMDALIAGTQASDELKNEFSAIRTKLNQYLDGFTGQVINGERLTRRKILDVFIYGSLAHANPDKKATLEAWASTDLVFMFVRNEFIWAMGFFLQHLYYLREICKDVLLAHKIPWFKIPPPPT